jgi:hypothetical protein
MTKDDARLLPAVADAGIFLLLVQPVELARERLAHGCGQGRDGIADPADHRHGDHHPERRNAAGPAREGTWLALCTPFRKRIVAGNCDVDGRLLEKLFDRHGASLAVRPHHNA